MPDKPGEIIIVGTGVEAIAFAAAMKAVQMMLKELKIEPSGGGSTRTIPHYVKGQLLLTLYFSGEVTDTKKRHTAEKSMRLTKYDPGTITFEQISALATKIKSKFNNWAFSTGTQTYCYGHPEIGFNRVWGHFFDETNAKKMFESMLDLINESPDYRRLTHSRVVNPGDRFSPTPNKVNQAGKLVRPDRERPTAIMKFEKATLKFPHIKNPLEIVDRYQNIIKDLSALDKLV